MRRHQDTMDKLIINHFKAFTRMPFVYKSTRYEPSPLRVSATLFKKFSYTDPHAIYCLAKTLDYIPKSRMSKLIMKRSVSIDNIKYRIKTYPIKETDIFCSHLDQKTGDCRTPNSKPLFCNFHPLSVYTNSKTGKLNKLVNRPSPQRLNRYKLNGEKGVGFKWESDFDMETHKIEMINKLVEMQKFMKYFKLPTKITPIIEWIISGPHKHSVIIN